MWLLAAPYKNIRFFIVCLVVSMIALYLLGLQSGRVLETVYGLEPGGSQSVWEGVYDFAVFFQREANLIAISLIAFILGEIIEIDIIHESIDGSENSYSSMIESHKFLVLITATFYSSLTLFFYYISTF